MKFTLLKIKNFKGIEETSINLNRCSGNNIYTLIGLNESGKTTVLEAISYLTTATKDNELGLFDSKGFEFLDKPSKLIPIGKLQNFNDKISVSAYLTFEKGDKKQIIDYFRNTYNQELIIDGDAFNIEKRLVFENSELTKGPTTYWTIQLKIRDENNNIAELESSDTKWTDVISYIRDNMIPRILYFPTFLFDFPKKIYLDDNFPAETQNSRKINEYYKKIVQDILSAVDETATLDVHITSRLKGTDEQKRQADAFLSKMSSFISRTFFEQWDKIFKDDKKNSNRREVKLVSSKEGNFPVLTFKIKENDEEYYISERSLGFRWFFAFLLLTEIRGFRKDDKRILFLLDEPASNLHSSAQELILKSFEKTTKDGNKIIYSTHSQYLINPNWLENSFICKNETMNYDVKNMSSYSDNKAKITVTPYREFANKYPNKTTYFQPVLDILNYKPCKLSCIPNAVIMEGKTDFYTINYFKEILCKNSYNDFVIMPGLDGADGLDDIIRLYLGWGRKFIVILDNDKQGLASQKRYRQDYCLTDKQLFSLGDIDANFKTIESLVAPEDKDTYAIKKKKEINHFFQEKLATKTVLELNASLENFKKLLQFADTKLKEQ